MVSFPRPERAEGPLSILRGRIIESAANTLTEEAINTPVDPRVRVGLLVRQIYFSRDSGPDVDIPAADTQVAFTGRLVLSTRQGLTTIPALEDPGVIAAQNVSGMIGSQTADGGVTVQWDTSGNHWDYSPGGLLVVTQQLSLYAQGANLAAALGGSMMLLYQLVEVEAEDLAAALSAITDL